MIEVEITNYESIGHIKFSFDGFCTVTGRNFIGKSALLRAINAALTNQKGEQFIKWGETFCEVRIKTKDMDLLWHKESGNNFYEINGVKQKKIGKDGQPTQVVDSGFGIITTNADDEVNLHYCEQYNPLFLVDKRDSKAADLLISMYGLDKLYKALEFCNRDQRKNRDILKTRKEDLVVAKRDYDRFDGFEEILSEKDSIISKKEDIKSKEAIVDRLRILNTTIATVEKDIAKLSEVSAIEIPTGKDIEEAILTLGKMSNLRSQLTIVAQDLKRLEGHKDIVIPSEMSQDLGDKINEIEKLRTVYSRYTSLSSEVEGMEKVLADFILPKVPAVDFDTAGNLRRIYQDIQSTSKEANELKAALAEATKEHDATQQELDKFEACPVCGASLGDKNG
jgi:AAA15 family ATPase/GTPase